MSKREIASLVIKLMGVFVLIESLAYLPLAFSGLSGCMEIEWGAIVSWLMVLIPIAAGWFIIKLRDRIAAWLIREEDNTCLGTAVSAISKEDVMSVAISCIGLYIAVLAFPNLLFHASQIWSMRSAGNNLPGYYLSNFYIISQCLGPIVQIALGLWLFVGSKGIVKFWKKIRS